jgi:hypothetical protein
LRRQRHGNGYVRHLFNAAAAAKQADPQDVLTAEVRATYGLDEAAEPVLNITA